MLDDAKVRFAENLSQDVVSRKKQNRKSKLFYVSCDYLDLNNTGKDDLVINVHSDPINVLVPPESEAARKKRNRKSKLFYVSCEHIQVDSPQKNPGAHNGWNDSDTDSSSVASMPQRNPAADSDGESTTSITSHDIANLLSDAFHANKLPSPSDSLCSTTLPSCISFSSDPTIVNTTASSSTSDRSVGSVKRRPKRPNIRLTDQRAYQDYIEILREQERLRSASFSSIQSDGTDDLRSRPESFASDTSYLNIEDNLTVNPIKFGPGQLRYSASSESSLLPDYQQTAGVLRDLEDTLTREEVAMLSSYPHGHSRSDDAQNVVSRMCSERPHSPTSEFLAPLLSSDGRTASKDVLSEILRLLSPVLHKMKGLEEQSKELHSMQVKLAVLQEEKRQLCKMLTNKRTSRNASLSGNSTPTYLSDSDVGRTGVGKPIVTDEQIVPEMTSMAFAVPLARGMSPDINDLTSDVSQSKTVSSNKNHSLRDIAVQKDLELITSIAHKQTGTIPVSVVDRGFGDGVANVLSCDAVAQYSPSMTDAAVQNCPRKQTADNFTTPDLPELLHTAVGDGVAEVSFVSVGVQECPAHRDVSSQGEDPVTHQKSTMCGAPSANLVSTSTSCMKSCTADQGVGDSNAELICLDVGSQCKSEVQDSFTQFQLTETCDRASAIGSSFFSRNSVGVCCVPVSSDFSCGDNLAEIRTVDNAAQVELSSSSKFTMTDSPVVTNASISCQILAQKQSQSVACGSGKVTDVVCDQCSCKKSRSVGVGSYDGMKRFGLCKLDDKLCDCVKPVCVSTGVGDKSVYRDPCEKCSMRNTHSVGVGSDRIDDLLCDRCLNVQMRSVACGEDRTDSFLCDTCLSRGKLVSKAIGSDSVGSLFCDRCSNLSTSSVGVGDGDINISDCDTCKQKANAAGKSDPDNEDIFNFDLSAVTRSFTPQPQQALLCHYCGNKVDLQDSVLDENLQAMRESMQSLSSGMKRAPNSRNLALEFVQDSYALHSSGQVKDPSVSTPDEEFGTSLKNQFSYEDEDLYDEDEDIESGTSDVIEACKMLHAHFTGEKPLKQQQMVKYMGVIQTLWFKTVKRRRANAAVVKSYIDLFIQRIPELLETVINLTDDEGNTALHYALSYKNIPVASILMDSGECCVDLVNQAGYSPIMLAALVGFDNKNDKYIMQRLLRMGDINKEAAETGQTPLMLAVSRGNLNMVDLLLDAGSDINATDDEGSTALMCACEHGNINIVKALLAVPDCDVTVEDNEGSTALSIAMDARRKDLALLIYGSLNFDSRGKIKLSPSKQSLLGLGRRSPSPVIGRK